MAVTVTIDMAASTYQGVPAPAPLSRSDVAWIRKQLRRVCEDLDIGRGAWAVRIIPDAEMQALHGRFLGDTTTTDVITFDMRPSDMQAKGNLVQLDTAICIDEAQRQSVARHIPIRHEVLLYAVHSLLHVSGYDDRTPTQARRMHRREDELLSKLGVGPVYQTERPARRRMSTQSSGAGHA